jgi:hypothetical protein
MEVNYTVNGTTYTDEKSFKKALKEAKKEEARADAEADALFGIACDKTRQAYCMTLAVLPKEGEITSSIVFVPVGNALSECMPTAEDSHRYTIRCGMMAGEYHTVRLTGPTTTHVAIAACGVVAIRDCDADRISWYAIGSAGKDGRTAFSTKEFPGRVAALIEESFRTNGELRS